MNYLSPVERAHRPTTGSSKAHASGPERCPLSGKELPIPNVRFHGESWRRVSGRATEIAETMFMTHLYGPARIASRNDDLEVIGLALSCP